MALPWFHLPDIPPVGETAALDPREARHAAGARRLRSGEAVELFDGHGLVAGAELTGEAASASGVTVRVISRCQMARPAPEAHLACALPKGDRQSVMLGMAVQLGMSSFIPLVCQRSVARPGPAFGSRARRIFIEACKQSRRPFVPEIREPLDPAAAAAWGGRNAAMILLADPNGDALGRVLAGRAGGDQSPPPMLMIVGPEGGLTDEEATGIRDAGARPVSLGPGILRIETAAVAMLAALAAAGWGPSHAE